MSKHPLSTHTLTHAHMLTQTHPHICKRAGMIGVVVNLFLNMDYIQSKQAHF